MPNASAPNAPCVDVWLSPQTMVLPGCVAPSSGPMMCTMPRSSLSKPRSGMPKSLQLVCIWRICAAAEGPTTSMSASVRTGVVGVEWSIVASVRSTRRTGRPRSRSTVNACGEVTS